MRAKAISIKVEGKAGELYSHLLQVIDRPLPAPPTHYVLIDVITRDLSIKRVTIYFNPNDTWENKDHQQSKQDRIKHAGLMIGENSGFLDRDPNTLSYRFFIIEVGSNEVIYKSCIYSHLDFD